MKEHVVWTVFDAALQTSGTVSALKTMAVSFYDREKEAQMRSNEKAKEEVLKIAQLRQQYEQREQKRLKELSVSNINS